jgi:hypothetical protein
MSRAATYLLSSESIIRKVSSGSCLIVTVVLTACVSPGSADGGDAVLGTDAGNQATAGGREVQEVPPVAPHLEPSGLNDGLVVDENEDWVSTTVLSITFEQEATQEEREAAIDRVRGRVIGGFNPAGTGGAYYVQVGGDGTVDTIFRMAIDLNRLPQVYFARPYVRHGMDRGIGE